MGFLIGTSGWQYRDWKGFFYPPDIPQKRWLEYYSERFACVEVNNTFYRLPERETFESWKNATPPDFIFVIKASRFLTHIKRLRDVQEPVERLMKAAAGLGDKLGPILLQLPPNLQVDTDALDGTLRAFPSDQRIAVEFRHDSWFTEEVKQILTSHDAALCLVDRGSRVRSPLMSTADWTYLRLHEGAASPHPCYGRTALRSWVERLESVVTPTQDAYVFFNNDTRGCAIRDAMTFESLAGDRLVTPSGTTR